MHETIDQHAAWLLDVARRPPDDWSGFDEPRSEQYSDWASKFQCAYSCYALTALARAAPELRPECIEGIGNLIRRMLAPRCWDYWLHISDADDPIAEGNVMYSGHLLTMIGCLESLTGPSELDQTFRLQRRELVFEWDHHRIADRIRQQMADNPHHGVACQRGFVFVQCTNFAVLGLRMYDGIHGTNSEELIEAWLSWVDEHFVIDGDRGIFYEFYDSRRERMDRLSFRGLDAGGLMTLSAIDLDRARALHDEFIGLALESESNETTVHTGWLARVLGRLFGGMLEGAMTEAFTYVLARNLGDTKTAVSLRESMVRRYGTSPRSVGQAFDRVPGPLAFTALVTLGDTIRAGGLAEVFRG